MTLRVPTVLLSLTLFWLFTLPAYAELHVASFFDNHMVLQRDQAVPVWGTAEAGTEVTVSFRGHSVSTHAEEDGGWRIDLPELKVGEPVELRISANGKVIVLSDVLVGDVWLAGGQSNMARSVARTGNADQEIPAANYPMIRLFHVEPKYFPVALEEVEASWKICSPETVGDFSAVAYYFGRDLWNELRVPIGLVSSSQGGTPAEAWMPEEALTDYPEILERIHRVSELWKNDPNLEATLQEEFDAFIRRAEEVIDRPPLPEMDLFDTTAVLEGWQSVRPGQAFQQETDGLVSIRKVFTLTPARAETANAVLHLGTLKTYDHVWINGVKVGRTGRDISAPWRRLREYAVPEGTLRTGENAVLIQLIDWNNEAFFGRGVPKPFLALGPEEQIPLADGWEMKLVEDWGPRPEQLFRLARNSGSFLYNGMIAPLVPAAFRGVLWYQGESNTSRPGEYQRLFPDLIHSWRKRWNRGDFPFYFVQLANFSERTIEPAESEWAELREAQRLSLSLPNTGMAVIIDTSVRGDLHPMNKLDVGKRLALLALGDTYGIEFPYPHISPLFREAALEGSQVRIRFHHAEGGLRTTDGEPPSGFTIAGEDRLFRWADARLEGEDVIVFHPETPKPRFVRYSWANNPAVNLTNTASLPASPFQTKVPEHE